MGSGEDGWVVRLRLVAREDVFEEDAVRFFGGLSLCEAVRRRLTWRGRSAEVAGRDLRFLGGQELGGLESGEECDEGAGDDEGGTEREEAVLLLLR